ncbi:MFS transporter [Leekyejoonella antrihumi]|uniref:MFS transporter n=1 Tax=Leekyejoonella antrihumi TaxID=1660198 RepID=A0A563DTK0_9MICO|nr:MFS transporter [Leekyejoonella antrihumi]TWP33014.1 MFS transporter [Leekyejoonella antrihumi]
MSEAPTADDTPISQAPPPMHLVRGAIRETGTSIATVFGNPGLRRVNLAFLGSLIGTWAYATAITVWAFDFGGATAVGVWVVVRWVLMSVASPFTATLADRLPRRMVMIGSDLSSLILILVTGALIWQGAPALSVFVVATVTSLTGSPFRPAQAALIPQVAQTPGELTATNGVASTFESVAIFVGPALGAFLLAFTSVPVVALVDAVSFAWSITFVLRIRMPHRPKATGGPGEPGVMDTGGDDADDASGPGFRAEVSAGFRAIWSLRDVRIVIIIYCLQTVVAGASAVYVVVMASQFLSSGANGVGLIDSVSGIGAIVGGFLAIMLAPRGRLAGDFGIGVILWGLPLVMIAIWPSMWPMFAAMLVMGGANPVVDVNATTILQRLVPDAVLGRVFGAMESLLIATMAVGGLIMPVLIHVVGLRWGITVIAALVTVGTLPLLPALKRIDGAMREPAGLAVLRRVPLFAPLDPKKLERIASLLERQELPAGVAVIREGDPAGPYYVIESGRVEATYQGRQLSVEGADEGFGEIALIRDVPRTATVTTTEPTILLALQPSDFVEAITGNDEVGSRFDALISKRIPTI